MNVLGWILPPLGVDSADVRLSLTSSSNIPFYAQLKGFVPYLSPVSVNILLRLALVQWCCRVVPVSSNSQLCM